MESRDTDIVCEWIDAYYTGRDEDLVALAHAAVEIRPRAGQGERIYVGIDGVHAWLDDTRGARSAILAFTTTPMTDGRVLAESTLDGMPVQAVFVLRDGLIAGVTMYLSDRELLQQLGAIDGLAEPGPARRIGEGSGAGTA